MRAALFISLISTVLAISVQAQTVQLEVEPNHSTLGFSLDIAGGITKITGKFTDYKINLDYADQDLTKSKVSVQIQASSINTGIPDRDEHLKSPDFFNVESHPLITFDSDMITKKGDGYVAEGQFTMHGITKTLLLPLQMTGADGNTLGFAINTQVSRIDFGVGAEFKHSAIDNFLADNVDVEIYFWTRKKRTPKK